MAYSYTAYPVIADLTAMLASANITLTSAVSADVKQQALDSAVNEFELTTGRSFIPGSAGEVRYYDGSGTGRQVIDDVVSITDVSFFALPSVTAVSISNYAIEEHKPYQKNQLRIYQGPANSPVGYYSRFPVGRMNIQVTGTFGFTSCPPKVWRAILAKACADVADAARLTPQGMLIDFRDLDQDFKWSEKQLGMLAGWRDEYESAMKLFKRSLRDLRRRQVKVLV